MKTTLKVYIAVVSAIAGTLLFGGGVRLAESLWMPLVALALVGTVLEALPMELPFGTRFTLGTAVYFVAYLVYGGQVALWVIAIAVMASAVLTHAEGHKALFNASQYIVSLSIAGVVFHWADGSAGSDGIALLPAAAFVAVDFVVNTVLLSLVFRLISGQPFLTVWRSLVADAYLVHFILMTLGFVAAQMLTGGTMPILALVFVMIFLYRLNTSYFKALGASRERATLLGAILNSSDNGLLLVNEHDEVLHANPRAALFLERDTADLEGARASDLGLPELADAGESTELVLGREVERHLRYNRIPVQDDLGRALGTLLNLTDVTQEREAARRLKEYESSILMLVAAVDARDSYTHGHSERVSGYAVMLGRRLNLPAKTLEDLRYGGLLHDIGKIGVNDAVLRKRGPLTPEERAQMMEHPAKGAAILAEAGGFESMMPMVLYHHEWYGGGGYPTGRRAADMPLVARIMSVADAFDAMTSQRSYRSSMPLEKAVAQLIQGKGTQFDPALVDAFVAGLESGDIHRLNVEEEMAEAPPEPSEETTGRILPVHQKELQVVYRMASETRLFLDLERLLPKVLDILTESLGPERYYIALVDPQGRSVRVAAARPENGELTGPRGADPDAPGDIAGIVLRTGEPVSLDRENFGPVRPRYADTASAVAVPLPDGDTVVGALCCESASAHRFNRDSVHLMKAIGSQLASAVQIARYHQKVRAAAVRDGLTGAFNYSYFHEAAERSLAQSLEVGRPMSLAVIDVNGLKDVNDHYGHRAGDAVLCHYANVLKQTLSDRDVLARYGGDEFAAILPTTGASEARLRLGALDTLRGSKLEWDGHVIALKGMAWGVATFPDDASRVLDLVDAADRAMYRQKGMHDTVQAFAATAPLRTLPPTGARR